MERNEEMSMELLQVLCKTALPSPCNPPYRGIAFDGCCFYLTCPDLCQIVKCDSCFCEVEYFETLKPYTCICYDLKENCFWASSNKHCNTVFKLNHCFHEIDCITIHPKACDALITGISYDCTKDCLLVAVANCILCVNTSGCQKEKLIQKTDSIWKMGVLSVSPSYMTIEMRNARQCVAVYDCDSKLKCLFGIPSGYCAECIIFIPCTICCKERHRFYLLVTKSGCYSYLLECDLDCCGLEINDCNDMICYKDCCMPHCHRSEHACNDLIESIALIETALSHILNAEGEKLQKILACSDDIDKILCANDSINETIVNVTHLEIILHDKLATIKNCCHLCDCDAE